MMESSVEERDRPGVLETADIMVYMSVIIVGPESKNDGAGNTRQDSVDAWLMRRGGEAI